MGANMKMCTCFFTLILLMGQQSWSFGRLMSATSSSEQDVFRIELQFDNIVDPNKVSIQFSDRSMILTIPDADLRKNLPALEVKASFINEAKLFAAKDKTVSVEIQFAEIPALQMKENLAMEGLGKGLIIEVLPPIWNKAPAANVTGTGTAIATALDSKPSPEKPIVLGMAKDEKEIPLFDKKETQTSDSNGYGKIAFMVLSVIGLGAYLIWWMKNRSKMVNGPESLMKIKVVTQFHLGPKKTLAVVRVAGESLLLGITESQISLIKTLALLDEDLPEVSTEHFAETLENQDRPKAAKIPKAPRVSDSASDSELDSVLDEEFSFGPAVKTTLTHKIPMLRRMI